MELLVGFVFFEIVAMAAGFLLGRMVTEREGNNQGEPSSDIDICIYVPVRDRSGGVDNRPDKPMETETTGETGRHTIDEQVQVLQVIRTSKDVCKYEREILNEIIDQLTEKGERG